MSSALQVVTDADFDEVVLRSDVPVLVDFFTEWCGPCKALAPTLEDLSVEYGSTARIVSVDAEASPDLAARYGVTGYPTMLLISKGEEVSRPSVRTRGELREVIDQACGMVRAGATSTLPPEDESQDPEVEQLIARLTSLDAATWKQVEARVIELSAVEHPSAEPAFPVDEGALSAALTRLSDDVQELATARLGDLARATLIASAAQASFDRWVRRSPVRPGWSAALRTVPAARMSAYLPAGEAPADPSEAAAAFLSHLASLPDEQWIAIRAINRDVFPYAAMKEHGLTAYLAAVLVVQSVMSADLVAGLSDDAVWEPFEGVLERKPGKAA